MKSGHQGTQVSARTGALLLGLTLVAAPPVDAQTAQKFSLQVSGIGVSFFGSDFSALGTQLGGEAQLRYNHSAFSIGGGVQYTTEEIQAIGGANRQFEMIGAFIEPRYVFDIGSDRAAPYISGRFAVTDLDITDTDDAGNLLSEATDSGITVNGGGGILYRMGARTNLDVGATYGWQKLGIIGPAFNGVSTTGTNLLFRVGIAYGLGG